MSDQSQPYEIRDYVAILKIPGPITREDDLIQLSYKLSDFCEEVNSNGEIRAVIICEADEGAFCLEEGMEKGYLSAREISFERWHSPAERVAQIDLPVIAAIKGDAMGLGLELVLACDIRIAAETSHFGMPQIKLDMIPRDGGTQRLSRLVGGSKALEMILTGREIDAHEAHRIGLVNKIVSRETVTTTVEEMAKEMASKGPISLQYTKEAIYKGMDMTLEQGLRLEADLYMLIHTTRDREKGIMAFQEKRQPNFQGE